MIQISPTRKIIILFAFLFMIIINLRGQGTEFHVAVDGNDNWTGTLARPNAQKNDGPFATFERARLAVRQLTSRQGSLVKINIHQGRYARTSGLELSAADSAVTWQSFPGDSVFVQGGLYLNNFHTLQDEEALAHLDSAARENVLVADLKMAGVAVPEVLETTGPKVELLFRQQAMEISRFPNDEWTTTTGAFGDSIIRYSNRIKDEVASWGSVPDLWVHGYFYWDWFSSYQGVDSIDLKHKYLHLRPPQHRYGYRASQRFYFLNALQILDRPGEWYLDSQQQLLYFWPPDDIQYNDVYLSMLDSVMITLDGTSNVTIAGLILEGSYGSAIRMENGHDNTIAGCTVRHIIDDAIVIHGGFKNGVRDCDLYNLGAGGIIMEGGDRLTLEEAGHFAENNHIFNFANYQKTYHPAVSVRGVGHIISHNLIHDAPHMAIYFAGNEHRIEFNEIYDIARETGDVGAIYSGRDWTWRGNVVRYNYLHDIHGPGALGAVGVYLDDALCGTMVFGNIFYKSSMAVLVGGGRDNTMQNNIFIDCNPSIHVDNRGQGWASAHIAPGGPWHMYEKLQAVNYDQPPYSTRYPELANILDGDPAVPAGNKIIANLHHTGRWLDFDPASWDSIVYFHNNILTAEDPGFEDAAGHNWRLQSSFYQANPFFKKIPVDSIGLYVTEYRRHITKIESAKDQRKSGLKSINILNYPNPFNSETKIHLEISRPACYSVYIINVLGQKVKTLAKNERLAGISDFTLHSRDLASGIYFCQILGSEVSQVHKILLIK